MFYTKQYFWESVLLTIGESITANLDHVSLNNQSHFSLDVIEFHLELYDIKSAFTDTIGTNENCRKLYPICNKKDSDFSHKTPYCFSVNSLTSCCNAFTLCSLPNTCILYNITLTNDYSRVRDPAGLGVLGSSLICICMLIQHRESWYLLLRDDCGCHQGWHQWDWFCIISVRTGRANFVFYNYERVGSCSLFVSSGTYFDIGTSRWSQVNWSLCKCNLEFRLMRCVWP